MSAETPSILDRALDEIVADKSSQRNRDRRRGGGNRTPRDGVSKQSRPPRDPPRGNWVHDKYDDAGPTTSYRPRDTRDNVRDTQLSSRVRVENIHYDLNEADLREVFSRVGEIRRLDIIYDKAGRSEGIAHVTYSSPEEATLAVDQFNGANAKGQPIRVKIAQAQQGGRRGGGAVGGTEARSLFDRIGAPKETQEMEIDENGKRVPKNQRRDIQEMRQNARELGIDRYIPGDRGPPRDQRPRRGGMGGERERRRGNERGGHERGGHERGGRGGRGGEERPGGSHRPRKTAEELDAEMNDYWTTTGGDSTVQSAFAPGAASGFGAQPTMGESEQQPAGFNSNAYMAGLDAAAKASSINVDEDL